MLAASRLIFDSVPLATLGTALACLTVIALAWRRISNRSAAFRLLAIGLIVLGNAAGGPRWGSGRADAVAVMVDVSESTRGATYRDEEALRRRVAELLGQQPYTLLRFRDGAERTTWAPPPPDASAVLLFSDGRFDPPATSVPVYAIIDPALEQPGDAAVTSLQHRGEQLIVTTSNGGDAPRDLAMNGTKAPVPKGARTVALQATDTPGTIAQLSAGDAWPENDVLTLINLPPALSERWWVGEGATGANWRIFRPTDLPADASAWLAPSVVVVNNVPVDALSPGQAQRLEQYVRDLGGGLLILGGDRAFAAGAYDGSPLGALSPLASTPPSPAAHWTFLIDASGSMAGDVGGQTRLAAAVAAARGAIGHLPPNDLLSVGGFAEKLRWWTRGKPVKEFALGPAPSPRGPTNLDAALRSVAPSLDAGASNHVVLLTDGQVELPAGEAIAAALKATQARLHVFAIGNGPGLAALRRLADATGGTFAEELDTAAWAAGMRTMLRQVAPRYWNTTPVDVRFADLPAAGTSAWNRTWLKSGADELARTADEPHIPIAARIKVGAGNVAAVAFRPPVGHVEALAALVQSPPRDPRLKVTWRVGRELVVDIDASNDAASLNGLSPTVLLSAGNGAGASETFRLPQTGPGRYALALRAPRSSRIATLQVEGRVVDRFAVAGRYAPEFDAIGNDRAALGALANRTGGRVIEPGERTPLSLHSRAPDDGTDLAPPFATVGAVLVGLGLIAWRAKR